MSEAYHGTDASETALRDLYSWATSEAAAKAGRDSWYVPAGEYPTIAVMDNEAAFNITRGATFTDIIFRGDYGMVKPQYEEYVKRPGKFCSVDETQNLLDYNIIALTDEDRTSNAAISDLSLAADATICE